jgi:hypothetical protein
MNKIDPNSFVTIRGEYTKDTLNVFDETPISVEISVPWKLIHALEMNNRNKKMNYWLTLIGKNIAGVQPVYRLDEKVYKYLKKRITRVDFSIPDTKMVNKIDDMVIQAIAKTKVHTAIGSLDVSTE